MASGKLPTFGLTHFVAAEALAQGIGFGHRASGSSWHSGVQYDRMLGLNPIAWGKTTDVDQDRADLRREM